MGWETSDRRDHLPKDWKDLRQRRFRIDGYQCTAKMLDGSRCPSPAEECDHIGDRTDHRIEMLRSLCSWHHGQKTSKEASREAWKKRRQIKQRFRRSETHPGLL